MADSKQVDLACLAEECDYVRFTVADLNGIPRSKTVPRRHAAQALRDGLAIFGGIFGYGIGSSFVAMPELEEDHLGNGMLRPILSTSRRLCWAGNGRYRVSEYLCELDWLRPTPHPHLQCPRYVARQQLDRLSALGLRLKSGFEYEFYVVDNTGEPVFDGPHIFSSLAMSKIEADLFDLDDQLLRSGIDILCANCEYGGGQ